MKVSIVYCLLMAVVLFSVIDLSVSECCYVPLKCTANSKTVDRCFDCSEATVYCGKGPCNILGCNCGGGCRQGDSSLWCWNNASGCKGSFIYEQIGSFMITDVKGLMDSLDLDSDGQLNLREVKQFVLHSNLRNIDIRREFKKMDANGDGFLSLKEIDN